MASWHPPIPAGKLYSDDAIKLGPALAMLAWCYDRIQRDGTIEVHLSSAAADIGKPYGTIKDWWRLLREGPFFSEAIDRGKSGWIVRIDGEWIDWHVMGNNYPVQGRDVNLEEQSSSLDIGRNVNLDTVEVSVKAASRRRQGRDVNLENSAYKEDQHDHKTGDVATRKARTQRPPKEDTTPAAIREALADVCGIDTGICSKEQVINVNATAKRIYASGTKDGKTPDEIAETIRYVAKWFTKNDWRGKKGDRPTPKTLVDVWGSAIQERQNGHKPGDSRPALPVFKPDPNKPSFAETTKRYREANNDRSS